MTPIGRLERNCGQGRGHTIDQRFKIIGCSDEVGENKMVTIVQGEESETNSHESSNKYPRKAGTRLN